MKDFIQMLGLNEIDGELIGDLLDVLYRIEDYQQYNNFELSQLVDELQKLQ